jgi:ATP-dependent DNA helicase RecG
MTPRGDEKTRERLEILNRSNDGFEIASEDLRLRGPGELFGVRQSGELAFRVADIYADADVLSEASDAVEEILKQDRHLDSPGNARIRAAAERYRQSRLDVRSI